jgi:hypothetical protein
LAQNRLCCLPWHWCGGFACRKWFGDLNPKFDRGTGRSSSKNGGGGGGGGGSPNEYRTCYEGKWRGNQELLLEYLIDTQPRFSTRELREVVELSSTIILSCNYEGPNAPPGFDGAPPYSPADECAQRCSTAISNFCDTARCEAAQKTIDLPLCDILECPAL